MRCHEIAHRTQRCSGPLPRTSLRRLASLMAAAAERRVRHHNTDGTLPRRRFHAIGHSTRSRVEDKALGRPNPERPAGAVPARGRRDEIGEARGGRQGNRGTRIRRGRDRASGSRAPGVHDPLPDPADGGSRRHPADGLFGRGCGDARARRARAHSSICRVRSSLSYSWRFIGLSAVLIGPVSSSSRVGIVACPARFTEDGPGEGSVFPPPP